MAITSGHKLAIYNGALRRLGSRALASLTENREARRVLDGAWGSDDEMVRWMLERGEWNFAIRTVEGEYSPSIEPDFGFRYAFDQPTDLVRVAAVSGNDRFNPPLTAQEYTDEATYWFADLATIYVRYVSDDGDYGFNSAAWSQSFKEALEARLAWLVCERLTNSTSKKADLWRDMQDALKAAKSVDSMAEGVKFPPRGSWAASKGRSWT